MEKSNIEPAKLGARIRQQRKKLQLSQRHLATLLHSTQDVVCEYELGKSTPSSKNIFRLAVALHTSTDYLLGLTENPSPTPLSIAMQSQETELLQIFCSLPPQKRERAIGILIGLREG